MTKIEHTDGALEFGEYADGKLNGLGMSTDSNNQTLYAGLYKNGHKYGWGTEFLSNGDVYTGEFQNNQREGTGILISHKNSVKTRGPWVNGVSQG